MKRFFSYVVSALLCLPVLADNDDPVVISVNGNDIHKSELEYFYKKNRVAETETGKEIMEYADLYLNFKLKVQAAIDEGLDKSESFLKEFKEYRDMQAEDYMVDTLYLEECARMTYEESVNEVGPDGFSYMLMISAIPESEDPAEIESCISRIDSLYKCLEAGQDFTKLAKKHSNDRFAEDGGACGWMSRDQLPDEIADVLFTLAPGKYSEPFMFDDAFMIIMSAAHRDLGSYEDNRHQIYEWMRGEKKIMDEAYRRKARYYSEKFSWDMPEDSAVVYMDKVLEEIEPEFGFISQEYHDGLLLFEISNRMVWEKASKDTEGINSYFEKNRKKYRFEEPVFRGMVFFCLDEDVFHSIESAVEGLPVSQWADTIVTFNKKKSQVRAMRGSSETGIFKKGQNPYVDKLVFGEGEFEPLKGFPYVNVIGNVIDAPESVRDVITQVVEDYQKSLEEQWVKNLRKKYKYKINKKVLKKMSLE
ncbi:MAG: peptidylprolyl isomerase [Bacteroidaceae bacterium]|nr:peptidylprolyl isomerase [Bacteroidaceae bacterium]